MPKNISRQKSGPKSGPKAVKPADSGQRIAKVIARAGLCSRRDAEAWIAEGRVAVNGKVLDSPALNVSPGDQISVDGKPLVQRQRTRLFLFYKPRGLVTTNKDPEGRPTIFDYLHAHAPDTPRLMSIGRLDINTEGLLLLTNDGGLARLLELPTTGWLRRYRVRANGETHQGVLDELAKGITIDGIRYAGIEATFERQQGANCWLTMGLREGKNREIKRVLEHLGLAVNRLIRVSYGPFQLGDLEEGKIEEVRTRILRDQLGPTLAAEAGVDFDSPIELDTDEEPAPRRGRSERPAAKGGRRHAPRAKRAQPEPEEAVKHRPQPGPRKHISALRAQDTERAAGGRRRIETSETKDRKGRAVTIERRSEVKPARQKTGPHRAGAPAPARGSSEARPSRGRSEWTGSQEARPARNSASDRPRSDRSKTDHNRTDRYKSGKPGSDRSQPDRFKSDRPRSERVASDRPRSDRPKTDRYASERSTNERFKSDRPKTDRFKTDRPKTERFKTERFKTERSNTDRPKKDWKSERPKSERPKSERPKSERPNSDRSKSDRTKSERPRSDRSKSDRFKSDRPNRAPRADKPSAGPRGRAAPNKKPRGKN
jgi:23S rRNA pseudouridine2605 synthase